jgi:HD-like signal output (HDOD) protein
MKIELDLMADDMTAEVARVLDLMLEEPDVKLPVLPQVANEVRKLVSQENVSFERLSEVVALEPTMSARILEVANSPLYAGRETTRNLQQAVSRIGLRETRNILSAISAENLFKVSDRRLALLLTKLWMHSLACAYSNEIMAKDLYIAESGDYFMLGLLHDVGKLLFLQLIQQGFERKIWNKRIITDELLDTVLNTRHNRLGARLIQKWGYDKTFENVVYLHDDSYYVHEYDEAVVVTFFSNQMTRLMGFSLLPYDQQEDFLGHHEIAQALNMSRMCASVSRSPCARRCGKFRTATSTARKVERPTFLVPLQGFFHATSPIDDHHGKLSPLRCRAHPTGRNLGRAGTAGDDSQELYLCRILPTRSPYRRDQPYHRLSPPGRSPCDGRPRSARSGVATSRAGVRDVRLFCAGWGHPSPSRVRRSGRRTDPSGNSLQ